MNVIGIDPGTYSTGYAIYLEGKLSFAGDWNVKGRIDMRLGLMLSNIESLIIQYKPCEVACERTWGWGFKPAPELDSLIRALRGMARKRKTSFHLYSPSAVFGKWNKNRGVARAAVRQDIQRGPGGADMSDHAVDAVMIGNHHLQKSRLAEALQSNV